MASCQPIHTALTRRIAIKLTPADGGVFALFILLYWISP
jgi:hypothetical protein